MYDDYDDLMMDAYEARFEREEWGDYEEREGCFDDDECDDEYDDDEYDGEL
jgi:hypothetical protein